MKFETLPLGIYQANCYVIYNEETKETAVIDPGGDFEELKNYIDANKLTVKYIILTHAHGDHIGALRELKTYTDAPVCIHDGDNFMLQNSKKNYSVEIGCKKVELEGDILLEDGRVLELGNTKLNILHTPGHSKGSICIKCEDSLFSGDTLFAHSIGRTDLEGGSYEEIINSIKNKLMILPDETKVYPGHGSSTTIGEEKYRNPFLK